MRRVIGYLVIFAFFTAASVATARNRDGETGSPENGNEPAAKSNDPGKPELGENSKDALESEMQDLRDLLEAQNAELRELRMRLAAVESRGATSADAPALAPTSVAPETTIGATTPAMNSAVLAPATAMMQGSRAPDENKSPLSFKIGSAEFTPGGFLDFTNIYRSTNVGSGIATTFGSIPYSNTFPQAGLSEDRLSAQYSRLSLMVDAHLTDATKITGYVESDFLGYQPPNAYITANSDSLRLRVYWADVRHGKWEVLGGQEWSLLTPNRVGLSPLTSDIFYTLDEDPNFQVGLTWARQPQLRVVYHPTNNWAVGLSLENPQQLAPDSVVFPSTTFTTQFDNGSGATDVASAATNTAVPNLHPDLIVKTAADLHPGGHALHIEAAGLVRSFKVYNALTSPANTNTITGGGGSLNVNLEVIHNLRLIADTFWSDGGGRYLLGLGPDAIVQPNGTLSAVHSGSGLGGFEYQATPHSMFYAYYGGVYFQRNFGFLATTGTSCDGVPGFSCVGFGFPGSADTSNRTVQEGTFGIIPTLWSNENYGRLQIITQYSYVLRMPWSVLPGNPGSAHTNMVYAGIRYILP